MCMEGALDFLQLLPGQSCVQSMVMTCKLVHRVREYLQAQPTFLNNDPLWFIMWSGSVAASGLFYWSNQWWWGIAICTDLSEYDTSQFRDHATFAISHLIRVMKRAVVHVMERNWKRYICDMARYTVATLLQLDSTQSNDILLIVQTILGSS